MIQEKVPFIQPFDLKKISRFDKGLEYFENLYLRNAKKLITGVVCQHWISFKNGGPKKMLAKMTKIKVFPNCLKWRENLSKMIFELFSALPKKFGGRTKKFVKNEKNQSSSKLTEMARKLVENDF